MSSNSDFLIKFFNKDDNIPDNVEYTIGTIKDYIFSKLKIKFLPKNHELVLSGSIYIYEILNKEKKSFWGNKTYVKKEERGCLWVNGDYRFTIRGDTQEFIDFFLPEVERIMKKTGGILEIKKNFIDWD